MRKAIRSMGLKSGITIIPALIQSTISAYVHNNHCGIIQT